jgi:N-acetylneuraminic acid mutarotase
LINKQLQILMVLLLITATLLPVVDLSSAQSTSQPAEEKGKWVTMAPMPTARGGFGLVVVSGKIYAVGGLNGNASLGATEEYNPITNEWVTKTSMPTPRSGFAIAVYQNKIYVIGGTISGNEYVGNNEVYDPLTNTWVTKASMPTPRADLCANTVNDNIYLIGGKMYSSTNNYTETSINEVYNTKTNTWETKSPLPTAVQGYASALLNGKIYIMGGSRQHTSESTVMINANQEYNVQNDSWGKATPLPLVVSYGAAVATGNYMVPARIYYVGGYSSSEFSAKTEVYMPETKSWSLAGNFTPRAYLGFVVVNDILYAIGGFNGESWLNTNEMYKPIDYGMVPPKVYITSPENKTYVDATLTFTVNRGTAWIGYSLDNGLNVTVSANDEIHLAHLWQGEHSITMFANDSSGNMGASETVYFSIDSLAPRISILSPQNQSYDSTDVKLSFTVNENVTWMVYSLDGQNRMTLSGNQTLPALANGSHSLTIFASDEMGNLAQQTVFFNIAPFPVVQLVAVLASIIIALAAIYIVFKRKK